MDETRLVHNYSHLLQGIHSYQQMPMNLKLMSLLSVVLSPLYMVPAPMPDFPTSLLKHSSSAVENLCGLIVGPLEVD